MQQHSVLWSVYVWPKLIKNLNSGCTLSMSRVIWRLYLQETIWMSGYVWTAGTPVSDLYRVLFWHLLLVAHSVCRQHLQLPARIYWFWPQIFSHLNVAIKKVLVSFIYSWEDNSTKMQCKLYIDMSFCCFSKKPEGHKAYIHLYLSVRSLDTVQNIKGASSP